jgi:hypothetical protein
MSRRVSGRQRRKASFQFHGPLTVVSRRPGIQRPEPGIIVLGADGDAMLTYRLYTITSDEHIRAPPVLIECGDDQAAIEQGKTAFSRVRHKGLGARPARHTA